MSNAELGRESDRIVSLVTGREHTGSMWVNRTEKYISVKILTEHLNRQQLVRATSQLKKLFPDRFVKIYNSTATPGRMEYYDGEHHCIEWKEPKVNVRFTQE